MISSPVPIDLHYTCCTKVRRISRISFATPDMPGNEQFHAIDYEVDVHGTPVLSGVMTVLLCIRHAVYDAGDHSIVLGLVTDIRKADADRPPACLFRPFVPPGRQGGTAGIVRSCPSGPVLTPGRFGALQFRVRSHVLGPHPSSLQSHPALLQSPVTPTRILQKAGSRKRVQHYPH